MARRFLPGLRGLVSTKDVPTTDVETKAVYSGVDQILAAAAAGAINSGRVTTETWDIDRAVSDALTKVVWVYKAVSTIAENSARLPFILHDKDDNEVDDHPLYKVLNDGMANPLETGRMFRERLSMQVLLSPRGAFVEVIKNGLGEPIRLDLLPPGRTRPVPATGPKAGEKLISHFEVVPPNGVGDPRRLNVEDVRWFRKPHPILPFMGLTPLEAAGQSVLLDYFTRLYNLSFMRNDGRPGGILGVEGDMEESDMDRLESRFGRGPVEAGKLSVVTGQVSYVDTSTTPRDSQYQTATQNAKVEILVAFGVPESQIGNASGSTFANASEEGLAFWNGTMRNHNTLIATGFTADVQDESLKPLLDTSDVEVLQIAAQRAREEARKEWEAGLRSLISYATLADIDVEDTPLTRAHWITSGKQPIPAREEDADKLILPVTTAGADAPEGGGADTGTGGSSLPEGTSSAPAAAGPVPAGTGAEAGPPAGTSSVSASSGVPEGTVSRPSVATSPNSPSPAPEGKRLRLEVKTLDAPVLESQTPTALLDSTETAVQGALAAVAQRQAEVVATRVVGPKARKGTRHWVAQDEKDTRGGTKGMNITAVVDAARWEREVETAVRPIVERAAEAAAAGLLDDLRIDATETKAGPRTDREGCTCCDGTGEHHNGRECYRCDGSGYVEGRERYEPVPCVALTDPEDKAARRTMSPPKRRVLTEQQRKAIAETTTEALWVAKAAIRAHTESLAQRIKDVEDSGADVDAIVQAVRDYAEQYGRGWSTVVALQVSQAAVEGSRVRVADLSKKQRDIERTWVSRRDSLVRDTHTSTAGADGQKQRLGHPFKIGGFLVRYPGDPLAPPAISRNCRCKVVFRSKTTRRFISPPAGERVSARSTVGVKSLRLDRGSDAAPPAVSR